jgi:hypothetical protein
MLPPRIDRNLAAPRKTAGAPSGLPAAIEFGEQFKQEQAKAPPVAVLFPAIPGQFDSLRNTINRAALSAYYTTTATCLVLLRPALAVSESSHFRLELIRAVTS